MSGQSLRDAAVWYAENGFHIFPLYGIGTNGRCECGKWDCKSPGKHPSAEAPKGVHSATRDVERVRVLWTKKPNRNIGLSPSHSGHGVVDIDSGNGKDGEASLEMLVAKHGPLPKSWEVVTGSGGRHLYFLAGRFPTNVMTYGVPNIDTRGLGGYVVAPPSRHISGKAYQWKDGHDPISCQIAAAPPWLLQAAPAPARRISTPRPRGNGDVTRNRRTGLVVDGRETFLRDITLFEFWEMFSGSGSVPDAAILAERCWQRFSAEADLQDGRWTKQDAQAKARYTVKRFHEGRLSTELAPTTIVADVPPHFRSAHLDGAAASQRLEKVLGKFINAFETYQAATAELAHTKTAYEGLDRKARDAELRKAKTDLHKRFGSKCLQPPRLQIAAPAGIGKTSRYIRAYVASPLLQSLHIDYFVPTMERAEELSVALQTAFRNLGMDGGALVQVMYGRSDPRHGRCHPDRKELVASLEKKSRSVHKLLCRSLDLSGDGFPVEVECPFSDWCQKEGYQSQFATSGPKLRIWPHAQLPLMQHEDLRLPEAALVIVDESCVSALCKKGSTLELAELANAANYTDTNGGIDQAALAIGNRLRAAIKLERGSVQLQPLRDAQITADELRHAERSALRTAKNRSLVVLADWPEDTIKSAIDDHQYCGASTVAGILGQLASAMETGRQASTAVSIQAVRQFNRADGIIIGHKLVLSTASPPRVPASAGLLLLDADANAEINRRLFGPELRHITIRAKRLGYVKQVYSAPFSKYSLSHAGGAGLRAKIELLIAGYVDGGKKVLVGCTLAVRRALTRETPEKLPQCANWNGAAVTHFGAFVGSNAWEKYDVVIVLGREQPPPSAVEDTARALWPDEEMNLPGEYASEVRGFALRNGQRVGVHVMVHPEPRAQMVLDLQRERATGQLIDRLRLMFHDDRQPEIVVISNLPIPGLTVDELVTLDELLEGGSKWHVALDTQAGVLPLQANYLVDTFMFSALFGPARSVARDVSGLLREPWRRPAGSRIVQYRRQGSRGPLSSALVADHVRDIAAQLAERHGVEVTAIAVEQCQTEIPCHSANNTTSELTGFFRLSDTDTIGVVPRPGSKGSWQILARQLGRPVEGLRKRYSTGTRRDTLNAAYETHGSFWRVHMQGERYSVDVKLPGIEAGDGAAAASRLIAAGLECSWIMPRQVPEPTGEVVLFTPAAPRRRRTASVERRIRGR